MGKENLWCRIHRPITDSDNYFSSDLTEVHQVFMLIRQTPKLWTDTDNTYIQGNRSVMSKVERALSRSLIKVPPPQRGTPSFPVIFRWTGSWREMTGNDMKLTGNAGKWREVDGNDGNLTKNDRKWREVDRKWWELNGKWRGPMLERPLSVVDGEKYLQRKYLKLDLYRSYIWDDEDRTLKVQSC